MKKQLLITLLTLTVSVQAQITIPNASFENWTTASGFNPDIPVGWKPNSFSSGATKTTITHTGTYAMKLAVVKQFTGITSADASTGFLIPTINTPPLYYSFWAKVHLGSNDKLGVDADVYKKTSTTMITSIPYGQNELTTTNNTTAWTKFTYTLQTSFFQPCDTVNLRFYFSPASDTSSYVIVDDLAFSNAPAGVNELSNNAIIESTFPNPANTDATLLYRINEPAKVSLTLYDILGKGYPIIEKEYHQQGSYKVGVDVRDYASGIYYLHLHVNGQQYVQKIVVCH